MSVWKLKCRLQLRRSWRSWQKKSSIRRRSWHWWQSHSLVVNNFLSSDYLPFIASGKGGLAFSDASIQLFLHGPTAGWPGEQWGAASQRLVSMATALSWVKSVHPYILWDVASPGWEGSVKISQSPAVLQGFISFPQMNLLLWNLN